MEWGVMNHIGSRNSRICFLACEEQSTRRWISEFQILIVVFNLKASAGLIFPRECVDRLAVRLELLLRFAWPLLNSTVGPLPGIGFQDFSNSRRVQLCWPLTPKTQRRSVDCVDVNSRAAPWSTSVAEECLLGILRSELSSTIEQNRTCSPPCLSISCHKGKLSLPLDISRLNSVIQLHQSWLSKGVNLDSERHVAQRFLQHVMEMLPDSIWMCYWTVCHLTTHVTTSQNQRSHAVNALCILSTLSESPSVNFKKVTDVLHNYLLYN